MKKLCHPLWTHLPAAAALILLIASIAMRDGLPAQVPVHFGFNGEPDSYGSPWSVFGLIIGLSVFFMVLSAFLDELWARQEKTKTFNWLSMFDEVVIGAMTGFGIGYLDFIGQDLSSFGLPLNYLIIAVGAAVILAVILEMLRPHRSYTGHLSQRDNRALLEELAGRIKEDSPFFYWDYQNPLYVSLLTTVLPLVMLLAGVLIWFNDAPASIILFAVAVMLIIPYGGQRVVVTRQDIKVRFGILGIRVLRLRSDEIEGVEIHEFAPLRDFGGYGIRFNREMKAYFLRGSRGVKLTSTGGKKYLIGSDDADSLATVIDAVVAARAVA